MQMEEMLILESRLASGKIDIHPKARKTRSRTDSTEISESSCSTSSTSKSLEPCSSFKSPSTEPFESKYQLERARNAALCSRLQTLCGNIHVVCRVRPVLERISAIRIVSASDVAIHLSSNTQISPNESSYWKTFSFDRVFGPMETQAQLFSHVEPIAQSVVDGYNACIFAYGQTGSGKTYTMQGTDQNPGVNHRILEYLMTASDGFRVQLGALEIYNDTLRDLSDNTNTQHLELRQNEDKHIHIAGLQMQSVSTMNQALSILTAYHHNRVCGTTQIHAESSRSHLIVIVQLISIEPPQSVCGKLYLVDLAGSERVKKSCVGGVMLKEAAHINKSLSALADVMEALDKKAAFVPYRNSKLTFLLQDVLQASCKTLMIVNIAPEIDTASETYRSLQLATRARNVVIRKAIRKNPSKHFSAEENTLQTQLDAVTRRNAELQKKLKALGQTQLQCDNAKQLLERRIRELSSKWNAECKQRKCLENAVKRLEMEIQKLQKIERVTRKSGSRSWK
uniref:Kinesin-like protein n=1 Tax=Albugo laibachii Nc14 TaxID=890382 RepID=F0W4R4_9STRA|nr:kinesinlike protein putative [Albugo laibachii Nc14]|eukprot:CCA16099.1 kinesinlike protein putative [Albugo laibachii Nc14]